jgi:hypothetical protein
MWFDHALQTQLQGLKRGTAFVKILSQRIELPKRGQNLCFAGEPEVKGCLHGV